MKEKIIIRIISLVLVNTTAITAWLFSPAPAASQTIVNYCARLGQRDHYNSNGERLSTPAQILRQDRANFHRFNIRDPEDEWEGYFSSIQNRASMERTLQNTPFSSSARQEIVNGTPRVCVTVFSNSISVNLID